MKQHHGPVCPDNKVMCCYCFERVLIQDLSLDEEGNKQDVCIDCWDWEQWRLGKRDEDNNVLEP